MDVSTAGRVGFRLLGAYFAITGARNLAQLIHITHAPGWFLVVATLSSAIGAVAALLLWVYSDRLAETTPSPDDRHTGVERFVPLGLRLLGVSFVVFGLAHFISVPQLWPRLIFGPLALFGAGVVLWMAAGRISELLPTAGKRDSEWQHITVVGLQLIGVTFLVQAIVDFVALVPGIASSISKGGTGSGLLARELVPIVVQGALAAGSIVWSAKLVASSTGPTFADDKTEG